MASQMRNWFLHLSLREIDGLSQKLLDYDKKRRVNYEEGLASKVESDMILMMNQLGQLIEKEDSLFRGSMMQCGSSYNRTKIGQPDEMDFAFHWDLSETRSKNVVGVNFSFHGQKPFERLQRLNLLPETSKTGVLPVDSVDVSFSVKSADNSSTENADSTNAVVDRLLPRYIHERFEEAVNAAMMKLPLLPDWEHGGFGNPDCTGTRKNGPAMMLQFNYNAGDGGKLKLTLDLVLAIDLREIYDGDLSELCIVDMGPPWQQELLKRKQLLDKVLTKIYDSIHLDTTFAERIWLSTMDTDHPVKITVRIFKILNQMALQLPDPDMTVDSALFTVDKNHMLSMRGLRRKMANYSANEDKERGREQIRKKLRLHSVKQLQYYDMKVPDGERFMDVGESLGERPYLKSHVFQSVVLALYALSCAQHPDVEEDKIWTRSDLPTVVANVMIVVQQFLDVAIDNDPDSQGYRYSVFPSIQLETEGSLYRLQTPKSFCLDVYRGDTIKRHFGRMWHFFQQLTTREDRTELEEGGSPPAATADKIVHLLPFTFRDNEG